MGKNSKINVKTTLWKVMIKKVLSMHHYVKTKNENEKKSQLSMVSKKKMSKLQLLTMARYRTIIQKYTIDYSHTHLHRNSNFKLILMLILFTFDYQKFQI